MIILVIALHYFYKVYGDRPTFNVPNENLDTSHYIDCYTDFLDLSESQKIR